MSERIRVPEGAGGVVSFHFGEQNPVHTHEVVDGYVDCEECADRLDEAHRAAGFEVEE